MDPITLTAGIMAVLTPFLTKAGEEVAKSAGKGLYNKITSLFDQDEEIKTLQTAEASPDRRNLIELEKVIQDKLTKNAEKKDEFVSELNISRTDEFIAGEILKNAAILREDIRVLSREQLDVGVGTEGDYSARIALQERKLRKLEKKFISLTQKKF